jgi:hypothetical protein
MYDFHGRNRKPQIALAESFGFSEYAQPAGGCCFLTDKSYSNKLVDLWQSRGMRNYELDDIMLLKVGRHLRPASHYKIIVSREEGENHYLSGYRNEFISLETKSHNGPIALIDGSPDERDIELAASIVARYSQGRDADQVQVEVRMQDGSLRELNVKPLPPGDIVSAWHV